MRAYLISTGTELLLGQIVNSNARYLAQQLAELGIDLYTQVTVGDNRDRIAEAIAAAREKADLVIINGGLGPTEDDVTREALAQALGLPLKQNQEALAVVERFFRERGRCMPEANLKLALAPENAVVLDNAIGTAPGLFLTHEGITYILLPGPPKEMQLMFQKEVLPRLKEQRGCGEVIKSRVLKVIGLGEPAVEEKVKDLLGSTNPTLAPTVKLGEVHLRLTAKAQDLSQALELMEPLEKQVRQRLGEYIYGTDEESLEQVVGRMLQERSLTIAVAESCTGGLLAHRLTNVPGSSAYFHFGAVTYANRWKTNLLGVPLGTLAAYGAVSPETAEAMASGVRRFASTDIGVGITGIAGPGGGTDTKPVGLVYMAVAYNDQVTVHQERFLGDRELIKAQAVQTALWLLWKILKTIPV